MFRRFCEIAEQAAVSASRREFLGRLGRGALMLAASVGGWLALPPAAEAAKRGVKCCGTQYNYGVCHPPRGNCVLVDSCVQGWGSWTGCRWDCGGTLITTSCG
jgi:hypothetical protein